MQRFVHCCAISPGTLASRCSGRSTMGQCRRQTEKAPCLLGVPGHMRVHAPTCASYMYIDACQNQIRGPLPAIIRFRLLRNNGNLYDWPAEFALRGTHSTVTVSFVCLPGLLSTGDYFLSIPLPSPAALILVSALVLFPSAALQVPNTLCTFCSFLHDHVATIVAAEVQGHERPSPEHRQGGP